MEFSRSFISPFSGARARGGSEEPVLLPVDHFSRHLHVLHLDLGHQDGLGASRQKRGRKPVPPRGDSVRSHGACPRYMGRYLVIRVAVVVVFVG